MSSGFNSDILVNGQIFHVQTEDRGPAHTVIDTVVYRNGMVLYRRSRNYESFAASPEFKPDVLKQQVDDHHRAVVDDLRSGALASEIAAAQEKAKQKVEDDKKNAVASSGIQLELLNPRSWLAGGNVSLEIAASRRADKQPAAGVEVEAVIEGALQETQHSAVSDESGRAQIQFRLPPLGTGDLALVIQTKTGAAKDQLRFSMRVKQKSQPAAESSQ